MLSEPAKVRLVSMPPAADAAGLPDAAAPPEAAGLADADPAGAALDGLAAALAGDAGALDAGAAAPPQAASRGTSDSTAARLRKALRPRDSWDPGSIPITPPSYPLVGIASEYHTADVKAC